MASIEDILNDFNNAKPCERVQYILDALIKLDTMGREATAVAISNGTFPTEEINHMSNLMIEGTVHLYHAMVEAKECCEMRDMLANGPDGTPGDILQ